MDGTTKRRARKRRLTVLAAAALGVTVLAAACGPSPAPPPPPSDCPGLDNPIVSTIYNRTNADRGAFGLGPLAWDPQLACNARDWSAEMAASGIFRHQDLGALIRSPAYADYASLGENILVGPGGMNGDQMHDAWMASPSHRANILGAFDSIGIGLARSSDGRLWATEEFGRHF